MTISITEATPADLPAVAALLEEMDQFYGVTQFDPLQDRIAQIHAMIFRDRPAANLLLARDANLVVGLASYSYLWPAVGLTQSLYLKELYVAETHRRQGVGQALMQHLEKIATDTGCSRLEWTTDRDNPEAQLFYENLGHKIYAGKAMYRIEPGQQSTGNAIPS